jgi:hypothetical protein
MVVYQSSGLRSRLADVQSFQQSWQKSKGRATRERGKIPKVCAHKALFGTRREDEQARRSRRLNVLDDAVDGVPAVLHDITMSISNDAVYSSRSTTDIPTAPVNILADRLLSRKRKRDGDAPPAKEPAARLTEPVPRANIPLHKAFSSTLLSSPSNSPRPPSLPQSFVVRVGLTLFPCNHPVQVAVRSVAEHSAVCRQ